MQTRLMLSYMYIVRLVIPRITLMIKHIFCAYQFTGLREVCTFGFLTCTAPVIEDTTQLGNHILAVVDTTTEEDQAKVGVDK